jgi:hypothetical protein
VAHECFSHLQWWLQHDDHEKAIPWATVTFPRPFVTLVRRGGIPQEVDRTTPGLPSFLFRASTLTWGLRSSLPEEKEIHHSDRNYRDKIIFMLKIKDVQEAAGCYAQFLRGHYFPDDKSDPQPPYVRECSEAKRQSLNNSGFRKWPLECSFESILTRYTGLSQLVLDI